MKTLHPAAWEFSQGAGGTAPPEPVVEMADRIMRAVMASTREPEHSVDIDGALSFEATLRDGTFVMCEVSIAGSIDAGLYRGADGPLEKFLARATENELMDLFQQDG